MKWSAAPFVWLSEPMPLVQLNAVLPTLGVKDEPTGFEYEAIGPSIIRSRAMGR